MIRHKPGHACDSGTSLVTRNDDGSFTGVKDLLVESAKQLASTAAA